jgi:hypothetical protein
VLIAMALFFVAVVAILELVSLSLRGARSLQISTPHAGMVAAELSLKLTSTNKVDLGSYSGDFGELYPDSRYEYEILEVPWATNTLRQIHITVYQRIEHRETTNSTLDLFLFLPNASQTGLGAGGPNRGGAR